MSAVASPREYDPWKLGHVNDFQLLGGRVASRHRSGHALIAKRGLARR